MSTSEGQHMADVKEKVREVLVWTCVEDETADRRPREGPKKRFMGILI